MTIKFGYLTCSLLLKFQLVQFQDNCSQWWEPAKPPTTTTTSVVATTTPVWTTTTTSSIITTTKPVSNTATTTSIVTTTKTVPTTTPTTSVVLITTTPAVTTTRTTSSLTTNTSASTTVTTAMTTTSTTSLAPIPTSVSVDSTILVIARDNEDVRGATEGLLGYGISWQTLLVPKAGIALPDLTTSGNPNFGGIIVASQVSYDFGGGNYQSALTTAQWQQLYTYQTTYGVRMVQWDVYPGPAYGATALGGCCGTGVEQLISFSNTSSFAQAGVKSGATVSTSGLYHYPASITDPSTTWEIAQFAANAQFKTPSTAGVINNFADGRQQMVFFIGFAWWSPSSAYMQHAWISWITRGLYAGYRRVNLNTQIDDIFLQTDMYWPTGNVYRVTPDDMTSIASWIPRLRARMNSGSIFYPELAHNGNGNIEASIQGVGGVRACGIGPVYTDERPDTALEFKKPLGTGTNAWPDTVQRYGFTTACLNLDPLNRWLSVPANRDLFMHISHTFTHYELNNATYADALREIQFNQAWIQQAGISAGRFSSDSLVPPAITGLHNGDVIRAWKDAGLTNVVGDNTRPVLRNQNNPMHAYTTSFASDGYDGFTVLPRFATRIYYNCDTPECDFREWQVISNGTGNFQNLLATELVDVTRNLFGLYHDAYMFHQANLRTTGLANNLSLYQQWVEMVVNEFVRLVNWPIVTLSQSDLAKSFVDRATRDSCGYKLIWNQSQSKSGTSSRATTITGFTVSSTGNSCAAEIPVTVPATLASLQNARSEKIGNDPQTIWVKLNGQPMTYQFSTPIVL